MTLGAEPGAPRASTEPVAAPSGPRGAARPPVTPERARARPRRLHTSSVATALVILAVTLGASAGILASNAAAVSSTLNNDEKKIASSLQASANAISVPLFAAAQVASFDESNFRSAVQGEVGSAASGVPFRSMSLWSLSRTGAPRRLEVVGSAPELSGAGGLGTRVIGTVAANSQLTVLGLFEHPRVLGVAERLEGSGSDLVVYAENWLPAPTPGSPLYGFTFALFFGRSTSPARLMESTVAVPVTGTTRTRTVAFANTTITVVVAVGRQATGALPSSIPPLVLGIGLLATLGSTLGVERRIRRREDAESLAFDAQREIAQTLQHALRPPTPSDVPGLELATRYVAGVKNLDVGGDWFDAFPVDASRLFVTVGDVSGRGLRAATVMGSLRSAIRAYALQGDEPEAVLTKLSGFVDVARDDCFATVLCCVFDVQHRVVTVANAGHPPPVLIDAAGARFASSHVGAPVGVRSKNLARPSSFEAVPGATFFLYTDGLIERHGRSLDEGLGLLLEAAARTQGTLDDLVEGILGALAPGGAEDDLAVFGLRWR